MADSFRSGPLSKWSIESLGLFDLKRIITIRPIGVWHQSTARAIESRRLLMLLIRFRSTLMSYIDRSVQRRFKSNAPMAKWFNAANGSPNSFKTCIKKLNAAVCCSETNSSALSLYFCWQNWAKQTTLHNINFLLTELLRKISITFALVWYCT